MGQGISMCRPTCTKYARRKAWCLQRVRSCGELSNHMLGSHTRVIERSEGTGGLGTWLFADPRTFSASGGLLW